MQFLIALAVRRLKLLFYYLLKGWLNVVLSTLSSWLAGVVVPGTVVSCSLFESLSCLDDTAGGSSNSSAMKTYLPYS